MKEFYQLCILNCLIASFNTIIVRLTLNTKLGSSVGESARLIIVRSGVRISLQLLEKENGVQMAKNDNRIVTTLECTACKRRNYVTKKNKVNNRERLVLSKFCEWCREHKDHKETK
jgi:large subunit ribosomal protein L33